MKMEFASNVSLEMDLVSAINVMGTSKGKLKAVFTIIVDPVNLIKVVFFEIGLTN